MALELCSSGRMMLVVACYSFGIENAMATLPTKEIAITRASIVRRAQSNLPCTTHLGCGPTGAIFSFSNSA